MKCEHWFPTPIWYGIYENIYETQYNNAIKYCKELATINPGRTFSNAGGWQSNDLYYKDIINTPLQIFFDEIKPKVKEVLLELGIKYDYYINNSWININGKGSKNHLHDHPGSSVSGVFYLTENNSEIIFERNRDINRYHMSNLHSNGDTFLSYNTLSYTPQQGQYIIFPSWLLHEVKTNNNDSDRISISFNVSNNI
jgi:uncharacterized protein (TIGR02466 family)